MAVQVPCPGDFPVAVRFPGPVGGFIADGTCLGAVYSAKTWLLVLCMMAGGIILRNSTLPISVLSFLYITIGSALGLSSRLAWSSWLKNR